MTMEQKRGDALRKDYDKRTIEDWIIILYGIYQEHNRLCNSHELWLQVVNDASQLAETVRRQIIRTKVSSEFNVYTQLARLFCRISAFIGRHIYDSESPLHHDPITELMRLKPLDDYIGGEERYEKWILWKYPYACPTCGNCPCVCAAYRDIMEDRNNPRYDDFWAKNVEQFVTKKNTYRQNDTGPNEKVIELCNSTIDDWVNMFYDIYGSGHIDMSLESIGFHFLEEIGEVSDGILCLNELFKHKERIGVYRQSKMDLHQKILERAIEDPQYEKFKQEYREKCPSGGEKIASEFAFRRLLEINISLTKEELADVFSWMCAILNKIRAANKYWNPEGQSLTISEALHQRYRTADGRVGCSYCSRAICAHDCLMGSTIRKSIIKRNQKLNHRLFS